MSFTIQSDTALSDTTQSEAAQFDTTQTDTTQPDTLEPNTARSIQIKQAPCTSSDTTCVRFEVIPRFTQTQSDTADPADYAGPDSTSPGLNDPAATNSTLDTQGFLENSQSNETSKLRATGSLSRSVLTGSNQQATLDGELQLLVEGPIGEDGQLKAQLNDRNIPIMPDGATQSLAELDRLRIDYMSSLGQATLGDVSIDYAETRFTPVKRMLQGASIVIQPDSSSLNHRSVVSLAAQRGEIHELTIQPKEGIRGPYPLQGKYNESSIIILPGTEKVWLNGQRLRRGIDQGYTLDAAFAEITYTGSEVLSSTDVLRVEFQYITQNYTRTLLQAQSTANGLASGRLSVTASYLREADANESERSDAFETLGDPLANIGISGVDSVGRLEDATYPLYVKIDTVIDGNATTYYDYRPGDSKAVYRVRFSNLGEGLGSYKRLLDETNGIIYTWVGQGQGAYEPIVQAQPPVSRQLLTLAATTQIHPSWTLSAEWALSDVDANRFSSIDDQDNTDQGFWIVLQGDSLRVAGGLGGFGLEARMTGKRFETLDPIRDPMYAWRLGLEDPVSSFPSTSSSKTGPRIASTRALGLREMSLEQSATWRSAQRSIRVMTHNQWLSLGRYQGWAHQSKFTSPKASLEVQHTAWHDVGQRTSLNSSGRVPLTDVWFVGWDGRYRRQTLQDSLQRLDLQPRVGIQTTKAELSLYGRLRVLKRPSLASPSNESQSLASPSNASQSLASSSQAGPSQWIQQERIRGLGGEVLWEPNASVQAQQRFEWRVNQDQATQVNLFHQTRYGITPSRDQGLVLIQLDAEQRPTQSFSYVFVGPQFGTHVWDDVNQDGVEQFDEFFPALVPGEGDYVLRQLISTEFESLSTLRAQWQHQNQDPKSPWQWTSSIQLVEESRTENPLKLLSFDPSLYLNDQTTRMGRLTIDESIQWSAPTQTEGASAMAIQGASLQGLYTQSLRDAGRGIEDNAMVFIKLSATLGSQAGSTRTGSTRTGSTWTGSKWTPSVSWESNQVTSGAFSNRSYDLNRAHFMLMWSQRRSRSLTLQASAGSQFTQENRSLSRGGNTPRSQRHRAEFTVRSFTATRLQIRASVHGQWISSSPSTNPFVNFELTQGVGEGLGGGWSLDIQGEIGEFELGLQSVGVWVGNDPFGRDRATSLRQTVQATARWIL
ncbi:MAG: hypothetical protein RI519_06780 [Balneolaceae bacterium]|nr:hypothetical protein [Balneolaceae bacterium]